MAVSRRDPRVRLLIAGAVLLIVGLSAGAYLLRDRPQTCQGKTLQISVVAAPDITPALGDIATRFNVQPHEIGGRCARITIDMRDPAADVRSLKNGESLDADASVPDASMLL